MMSFGCSMKPLTPKGCPLIQIPLELLAPTPVPEPDIQKWGDYPDYAVVLHQAITSCNTDKTAMRLLLKSCTSLACSHSLPRELRVEGPSGVLSH